MTAPARYTFDTVFPGRHTAHENHASVPKFTDSDIRTARDASYREGLVAGRQEVADQMTLMIDQKIECLLQLAGRIEGTMKSEVEQIAAQAADLAFVSARTLASALIAKEPDGELMHLFSECMSKVKDAPHLVIRVPDTDLEVLRARIENVAASSGYEGKIILLAEDDLTDGDCRIEWADGGISRERGELETQISGLIDSRFCDDLQTENTEPQAPDNPGYAQQNCAPEGTDQ